ncbi:MAG: RluA family pseudouridine synthase [Acetobacter sp.]|nr:RluA family pseudouridine synthase [Acetobacter sp.]
MSGVELIRVKSEDDGIRLNRWFLKYYPGLSLGRLQKLLRTKQIKVDGQRVEANTRLEKGQEVRVPPLENEKKEITHTEVSVRDSKYIEGMIIYKDENIIVLNKPSGLAVQGGTNTIRHVDGLLDALKFGNEEKPKLVHRIDKDTSGVLVLARNRKMADILTKAFREHTLQKTYLALTRGVPDKEFGEIKVSLEKADGRVRVLDGGKNAITIYEVLDSVSDKFALISASPLTGRTHQIRAHLEYIGAPILGDDKYFGSERVKSSLFINKLHLHAYKIDLSFVYGKKMVVKAKLPNYFKDSLKTLGLSFKE